jgi:KipI family sensor histidine kinase inhibitor
MTASSAVSRVARCGDRALLLDCADPPAVAEAVRAQALDGVLEAVPGAVTVLVRHTADADADALGRALYAVVPAVRTPDAAAVVTIPVRYDGPDLDDVAEIAGISREAVAALHQASELEVAFCGFSPGFSYLRGLDPRLHVPRLATPRTRVPAGSVAVADVWSAVYPRESPGGWRILGTTDAVLWDERRDPPALLAPGTRVRFAAVAP